jgi:hypothetical protein
MMTLFPRSPSAKKGPARRVLAGLLGLLAPALVVGWLGLRALRRYLVAA